MNFPQKKSFLTPDFDDLFDPFRLSNCRQAVERIIKAERDGEKIGIFADYDADGIPAAALLYRAFNQIGLKSAVFIPNRERGYGLSKEGIDFLTELNCKLIITADLGIRNFLEALYCQEKKIDLIVTDHHLPADELPKASLIINPKIPGDKYPFKELSGCGVVYKLIQGLSKFYAKLDESFLKWNLDLVAISTIADVVPLVSENRIFAKFGLTVLRKTKNLGLKRIMSLAGIKADEIGSYQVGFQIAPRINAPGRIDHATKSYELLVTDDIGKADDLAGWLEEKNNLRQKAMERAEREAIAIVEKEELSKNKILIIKGDWQKGVLGPTASRIVEKTNRPTILFSSDDEKITGSARSVSGVDIVKLLDQVKKYIDKYGGHKGAAGLSVKAGLYKKFYEKMLAYANKEIKDNDLVKRITIDCEIAPKELSQTMYEKIIQLEPFGLGNSKPVFLLRNVKIISHRFVGKEEKHLSLNIECSSNTYKSIYFSFPYSKSLLSKNLEYDIVFSLNKETWQGRSNLSLNIIDIKNAKKRVKLFIFVIIAVTSSAPGLDVAKRVESGTLLKN